MEETRWLHFDLQYAAWVEDRRLIMGPCYQIYPGNRWRE